MTPPRELDAPSHAAGSPTLPADAPASLARAAALAAERAGEELRTRFAAEAARQPVEPYLQALRAWPAAGSYNRVPAAVAALAAAVERAGGVPYLAAVHRYALADLLARRHEPAGVAWDASATDEWFERTALLVLADLFTAEDRALTWRSDTFVKDLAVCSRRALCCGSRLVDPREGLSVRLLASGGAWTALRAVGAVARLGGRAPVYHTHLYARTVSAFSEAGFAETLRIAARVMEGDAACRAFVQSSWYFDPALATVSPRLRYLRDTVVRGGASLFRIAATRGTVSSALAKSPTRRAMHERGEYVPRQYLVVWPRARFLKWAARELGAALPARRTA